MIDSCDCACDWVRWLYGRVVNTTAPPPDLNSADWLQITSKLQDGSAHIQDTLASLLCSRFYTVSNTLLKNLP